MSRNNFRDPETGEEFHIPTFRSSYKGGKKIHKDAAGRELTNPETGNVLEFIKRPAEEFGVPMMAKYNHKTAEGQKAIKSHFGARSHKDDTKGAGSMEKREREGAFKKNLMEDIKSGKTKLG